MRGNINERKKNGEGIQLGRKDGQENYYPTINVVLMFDGQTGREPPPAPPENHLSRGCPLTTARARGAPTRPDTRQAGAPPARAADRSLSIGTGTQVGPDGS